MVELVDGRGRVRERRPSAAAARASRRHGGDDLGARPRSGDRRAAGVRHRHGAVSAGLDRGRLHGRRDRGAARAARGWSASSAWTRSCRSTASSRRRRSRRPRWPARWAEGELADDFAIVVVKRAEQPKDSDGVNHRRTALAALVFGAGTGSLATEIAASRMLAPYFGSSTIVWAEPDRDRARRSRGRLLAGGRVADRHPEPRLLGLIVLAATTLIAMTPSSPALPRRGGRQPRRRFGRSGDRLVLRRPAPVRAGRRPARDGLALRDPARDHRRRDGRCRCRSLLRAVDVRLAARHVRSCPDRDPARQDAADAAPDRSAARALGLVPARPQAARLVGAIAALAAIPPGAIKSDRGCCEEDSLYQFIQVLERDDGRRLLRLNEGVAVHSVWREDTVLTGGVWDAFLALPPLLDRPCDPLRSWATRAGRPRAWASSIPARRSTGSSSTLP